MSLRRSMPLCVGVTLLAGAAAAQPYTDPSLLDMPWGRYSFEKQAWRGYLETVPAIDYLEGLGVVWGQMPPGKSADDMAEQLAWAGFKRVRIEVPWGSVKWDETGFEEHSAARLAEILRALRVHGLRPLILLNANHLQPCPVQWRELRAERDTPAGDRTLAVAGDLAGVEAGTATLMTLADGVRAGPMIAGQTRNGRGYVVTLSKGLPRAVERGEVLRVAVLAYQPLFPVGTSEFERTVAGWLRYVQLVGSFVREHYGDAFDVEIWNEYTFGSAFLDIDYYRDPPTFRGAPEPFHPGGRVWELTNRTVRALERDYPRVDVIWGFSNTSFFHVKVAELPAGIDGQSYHPYGTGRRCYADAVRSQEQRRLLDGDVPPGCVVQPEGWAHTWYQTESLVRVVAPSVRGARPPGSTRFRHFITEHGFDPDDSGIADMRAVRRAKQKFLLRAPLLWLNKGIAALYVYNAYDSDERGFGMFEADGDVSDALRSLHELTSRLAGATPIEAPRPLTIAATRAAGGAGSRDAGGPPTQDDRLAVLPFQVAERKFALGVYVMTQDFPADLSPQRYTITISGVRGTGARVAYFSPESGRIEEVTVIAQSERDLAVSLAVTDVPRLLEIEETAAAATP